MEVMERTAIGFCPTLSADHADICATRNDLESFSCRGFSFMAYDSFALSPNTACTASGYAKMQIQPG